jgi:predicted nucleic acid-binding protein
VIVLDASAALEMFLKTPLGLRRAGEVFGQERHAPALVDIEFAQALRRLTLAGEIQHDWAKLALETFRDTRIMRYSHVPLLERIWELRDSASAYDAAYIALAEALDLPLLTCDAKLTRSHGHNARIVLLS